MAMYTFYPCAVGAGATTFEALELADDREAIDQADAVLANHLSADFVIVWCGERRVFTRQRTHPVLHSLLSQEFSSPRLS